MMRRMPPSVHGSRVRCATRAFASSASSSQSPSVSVSQNVPSFEQSAAPHPSLVSPRRRSHKRRNYADRTAHQDTDDTVGLSLATSATTSSCHLFASFPSSSTQASVATVDCAPLLTRKDRLYLIRTRLWMRSLSVGCWGVGWAVVKLHQMFSSIAYFPMVSRVSYFSRRSLAPPFEVLVDAAPAEQRMDAEQGNTETSRASFLLDGEGSSSSIGGSGDRAERLLHLVGHPNLYIGNSNIHGRGIFTRTSLPKGTRILSIPKRYFVDSANDLKLLGDTHEKLPDTLHYTQPTGKARELVLQCAPHLFLNHHCESNCVVGLAPVFWPVILRAHQELLALLHAEAMNKDVAEGPMKTTTTSSMTSGSRLQVYLEVAAGKDGAVNHSQRLLSPYELGIAKLIQRISQWEYFHCPNSYFLTRDVAAGEEITVNYHARTAPLYRGQEWLNPEVQVCRCGSSQCHHFLFPASVHSLLRPFTTGSSSSSLLPTGSQPTTTTTTTTRSEDVVTPAPNSKNQVSIAELLAAGFDDEWALVSLVDNGIVEFATPSSSSAIRTQEKKKAEGESLEQDWRTGHAMMHYLQSMFGAREAHKATTLTELCDEWDRQQQKQLQNQTTLSIQPSKHDAARDCIVMERDGDDGQVTVTTANARGDVHPEREDDEKHHPTTRQGSVTVVPLPLPAQAIRMPVMERFSERKPTLLQSYRFGFRVLNDVAPETISSR